MIPKKCRLCTWPDINIMKGVCKKKACEYWAGMYKSGNIEMARSITGGNYDT